MVKICREHGISNQGGYLSFNEIMDVDNLKESIYIACTCEDVLRMRINDKEEFYVTEYEAYTENKIPTYLFENKDEFLEDMKNKMEQNLVLPDQPLIKVWVALCREEIFLCGVFHHLVTDGYSIAKILADAMEIYDLDKAGKESYVREKRLRADAYFNMEFPDKDKIQKMCDKLTFCAKSDLLCEKEWIIKQPAKEKRAEEYIWEIKNEMYEAVKNYEQEHRVFADAMFSAAIAVFINQVTGSDYAVIDKTQLNRNKKQLEMYGMFASTLPQVIYVDEEKMFSELCEDVAAENFKLMKASSCNKSELMEHSGFKGMFTADISLSYNNQKFAPVFRHGIRNDVFCGFQEIPLRIQVYEKENSFYIQMQYQTEVYSKFEIGQCSLALKYIIKQACQNNCKIMDISLGETHNLSTVSGKFEEKEEYLPTVIESFYECVDKNPYQIAFMYEENNHIVKMDYKKAGDCVFAIASYLKQNGVGHGDIVGIHMERSVMMPLAMLAAFLSGAAILPISIYESEAQCKKLYEKCKLIVDDEFVNGKGSDILAGEGRLENVEEQSLNHAPNDMAYYIQTSGTTGEPKLVSISNYSLSVRLNWHSKLFGKKGVFMQKTRNTFDVSIWELLYPSYAGATLYILPERKELDMSYIADKIKELSITHIHFVPSVLELFIEKGKWNKLHSLEYLISSGEALKATSVQELKENCKELKVYNLYGPAECTIDVTAHECTGDEKSVPIGRVADRTIISVRNKKGKIVPKGFMGEIIIEGDLVGEGYYQNETSESGYFTENVYTGQNKNNTNNNCPKTYIRKCYRTGDYGWFDENGELNYVGRKGSQKKLRGMRVDLCSIENKAVQSGLIIHAMADIEDNHCILYYQKKSNISKYIDVKQELSRYLRQELPYYYIPSEYYEVENSYISETGKLNRRKIKEERRKKLKDSEKSKTYSNIDYDGSYDIKEILESEINCQLEMYDNLFDKGMDSLNVMNVISKLQNIGYKMSSSDIYENPTLYSLLNMSKKQDVLYVRRRESKNLIIAIPYAGGKMESMLKLLNTDKKSDLLVPNMELIGKKFNDDEREMYKYLYDIVRENDTKSGQKVNILGYCVGSVFAMGLYDYLKHMDVVVGDLIFCGSLPFGSFKSNGEVSTVWDYTPDSMINMFLKYLGLKKSMTRKEVELFRKEVRLAAGLLRRSKNRVQISKGNRLILIYGQRDKLTLLWNRKYKLWRRYISGKVLVKCREGCGHYDLLG